MKRGLKWSDDDDASSSSDNSSNPPDSDSQHNNNNNNRDAKSTKRVDSAKKKSKGIDFEALSRHGYRGGLSVLRIPPPKEPEQEQNWSWSKGDEKQPKEDEESFEERQKTRAALADGERLLHAVTQKEKRNLSFQQKEKRKRDLGQASRGKNYVEEEKRLLRDNGVYSGFDA